MLGDNDFWKPIRFSNLKPMFSIYLFRGVFCIRGTYEIILNFFGTDMVQIQQNITYITYNLVPIMPFQTDLGRYCSQYWYSDISIIFFGAFQNRYCNFLENQYDILVYCTALALFSSFFGARWGGFLSWVVKDFKVNVLVNEKMSGMHHWEWNQGLWR